MTDWIRSFAVDTFAPMLGTLSRLLEKAESHPKATTLPDARLASDMFPLRRQVQLACFHARSGVSVLATGHTTATPDGPPDDDLTTLRALVATTVAELRAAPESAFAGAAERAISQPLLGGRVLEMNGARYLRDWAFGHFYFHVVTAYAILRHEGLELGKRDFMAHVGDAIRQA
ncbi:MAG TPA: DUF1993 domain-containing protein [Polyangiaceae bacterium]|jgi:hypothetical protein